MSVIVKSDLTRVVSYNIKGDEYADIIPGINQIQTRYFHHLKKRSDHFRALLDKGKLAIVTTDGRPPKDLDDLSAAAAIELINETRNTTLLREWKDKVTRTTVYNAVTNRLNILDKEKNSAKTTPPPPNEKQNSKPPDVE